MARSRAIRRTLPPVEPFESVAFVVSAVVALVLWAAWYLRLRRVRRLALGGSGATALALGPPLAWLAAFLIIVLFADSVVRASPLWIAFYTVMGMAWTGVVSLFLPILGVTPVTDVVERRNRVAAWPAIGILLGGALAYAGGNIGDGPGFWVVLIAAGLATWALLGLLFLVAVVARTDLRVTVDRDPAAAFRLALLAICMGAMLGRAVAGDWVSFGATLNDFVRDGWPAVALACLEMGVGRFPRIPRPNGRFELDVPGLFAGFVYVAFTVAQLIIVGWWR